MSSYVPRAHYLYSLKHSPSNDFTEDGIVPLKSRYLDCNTKGKDATRVTLRETSSSTFSSSPFSSSFIYNSLFFSLACKSFLICFPWSVWESLLSGLSCSVIWVLGRQLLGSESESIKWSAKNLELCSVPSSHPKYNAQEKTETENTVWFAVLSDVNASSS